MPFLEHLGERRYAYTIIPAAMVLFVAGAAFAWLLLIPTAIRFLAGFLPGIFQVQWTSDRYIPLVTSLLFWVGVCFEMPLLAWFLALRARPAEGLTVRPSGFPCRPARAPRASSRLP